MSGALAADDLGVLVLVATFCFRCYESVNFYLARPLQCCDCAGLAGRGSGLSRHCLRKGPGETGGYCNRIAGPTDKLCLIFNLFRQSKRSDAGKSFSTLYQTLLQALEKDLLWQ